MEQEKLTFSVFKRPGVRIIFAIAITGSFVAGLWLGQKWGERMEKDRIEALVTDVLGPILSDRRRLDARKQEATNRFCELSAFCDVDYHEGDYINIR